MIYYVLLSFKYIVIYNIVITGVNMPLNMIVIHRNEHVTNGINNKNNKNNKKGPLVS